jgi:hypothetical protein
MLDEPCSHCKLNVNDFTFRLLQRVRELERHPTPATPWVDRIVDAWLRGAQPSRVQPPRKPDLRIVE